MLRADGLAEGRRRVELPLDAELRRGLRPARLRTFELDQSRLRSHDRSKTRKSIKCNTADLPTTAPRGRAMTFDLAGGARLVLAGGGRGWLWVAAGGIALLLALALSREERRLVSRRAGLGLLGLRLLAVLVLMAALFEPIVARPVREAGRGRVIVAVDVSASMETADPGRSPDERRRLARTLGLGPAEPVESISRREVARRLLGDGRLARGPDRGRARGRGRRLRARGRAGDAREPGRDAPAPGAGRRPLGPDDRLGARAGEGAGRPRRPARRRHRPADRRPAQRPGRPRRDGRTARRAGGPRVPRRRSARRPLRATRRSPRSRPPRGCTRGTSRTSRRP